MASQNEQLIHHPFKSFTAGADIKAGHAVKVSDWDNGVAEVSPGGDDYAYVGIAADTVKAGTTLRVAVTPGDQIRSVIDASVTKYQVLAAGADGKLAPRTGTQVGIGIALTERTVAANGEEYIPVQLLRPTHLNRATALTPPSGSVATLAAVRGTAITDTTLPAATGGSSPITYSIPDSVIQVAGLSFDPATRVLSGTPTSGSEGSNPGTYEYDLLAVDNIGQRLHYDAIEITLT